MVGVRGPFACFGEVFCVVFFVVVRRRYIFVVKGCGLV